MQAKLVYEEKALDARIIAEKNLKIFSSDRLRILEALAEKPKYPAEVAKELKIHIQTAYYHFNLLEKAGIISRGATEEKRGALAKKFVFDADALAIIVRDRWKPFSGKRKKPPNYFEPFVKDGFLNAKIIVGSPDPQWPPPRARKRIVRHGTERAARLVRLVRIPSLLPGYRSEGKHAETKLVFAGRAEGEHGFGES